MGTSGGNGKWERTLEGRPCPAAIPLSQAPSLPARAAQQLLQAVERGAAVGPGPVTRRFHVGRGARLVPGADPRLPAARHCLAVAGKAPWGPRGQADSSSVGHTAGPGTDPVDPFPRLGGWDAGGRSGPIAPKVPARGAKGRGREGTLRTGWEGPRRRAWSWREVGPAVGRGGARDLCQSTVLLPKFNSLKITNGETFRCH